MSNIDAFNPEKIDFLSPTFSFKRLREAVHTYYAENKPLREATAETTFGQLLRAGIQQFAINSYEVVPVVYPDLVTEISSRRRQEWYAPLYRPNIPKMVDTGQKFQDSQVKGLDRELVNYKFGMIESFERELFDDDQTGQIRNRAALMGENFKILEEIWVVKRLVGASASEQGVDVPASTLDDGSVFTTAKGNRPSSYALLTQGALEASNTALRKIKDPLGNRFLVNPTVLLVSPDDEFNALKLLNSALQPSVPSSTTGDTGYTMTFNPLQGRYQLKVSVFAPSRSWMIGDFKKGFVFQRRDPLEIVQENPASGDSFAMDSYRFRARSRFTADWIESRFAYCGNDGSVTS